MKKFILFLCLLATLQGQAQLTGSYYVAARTGLSMRETPDAKGKVIEKIPYGTKVTLLPATEELKSIVTEGMLGFWQKVKYNNKTGYILDSYLLPWAPPKLATVKEMKQYLAQVTAPFGAKLVTKSGSMNNIEEGGWQINKQLFKNGAEWHEHMGYEYGSDAYFLPGFSMQQGFLLLRLIPEFSNVFSEKDEFPTKDETIKRGDIECTVKVEKEMLGDRPWYTKVKVEYGDGAFYSFEMYMLDNQLVIFFGAGV
mgnify:CR=1 FL=1